MPLYSYAGYKITTLDTITGGGIYAPNIAIDSNNKIHISYDYGSNLKYVTNTSGVWTYSMVEKDITVYWNSIAIDKNNKIHISYNDLGL